MNKHHSGGATNNSFMEPQAKRLRANQEKMDKGYFDSYADLSVHETMIADKARMVTYRLAILKNYEHIRGKVVADIGAGTGVLSIFCAHAGAKRVYAIEASSLAKQTRLVVKSNNLQEKITVINSTVETAELPEKVDVIVSEWMGYFLLYENMLPSVIHARDKWLKPAGIILPNTASIYMAPISDSECYDSRLAFWDNEPQKYEVNMSCLKGFARECLTNHVHVDMVPVECIVAHACKIAHLDLQTITAKQLEETKGSFEFCCYGSNTVHGFSAWFDVGFPTDMILSTSPYEPETHWQQCIMYVDEPFRVEQDTKIAGNLSIKPSQKGVRFLDIELNYKLDGSELKPKLYFMNDVIA